MCETRKSQLKVLRDELRKGIVSQKVIQRCPNTCVVLVVAHYGHRYDAVGFAKVRWPDVWDADYGITLAREKAIAHLAREIDNEAVSFPATVFEQGGIAVNISP